MFQTTTLTNTTANMYHWDNETYKTTYTIPHATSNQQNQLPYTPESAQIEHNTYTPHTNPTETLTNMLLPPYQGYTQNPTIQNPPTQHDSKKEAKVKVNALLRPAKTVQDFPNLVPYLRLIEQYNTKTDEPIEQENTGTFVCDICLPTDRQNEGQVVYKNHNARQFNQLKTRLMRHLTSAKHLISAKHINENIQYMEENRYVQRKPATKTMTFDNNTPKTNNDNYNIKNLELNDTPTTGNNNPNPNPTETQTTNASNNKPKHKTKTKTKTTRHTNKKLHNYIISLEKKFQLFEQQTKDNFRKWENNKTKSLTTTTNTQKNPKRKK